MKRFWALAILMAFLLCGCGKTPKQTAQDFINACENGDFKKAAGMVYRDGKFLTERNTDLKIGFGVSSFNRYSGISEKEHVSYKLSPREPVFEAGNPNKCRVCVLTGYFRNGEQTPFYTKEVAWTMEKIDGNWVITGKSSDWE